jgi:hypothetical protein
MSGFSEKNLFIKKLMWTYRWQRLLLIYSAMVIPLACMPAIAQVIPDYSRTPVLFIHGHGLNSGMWQNMRAGLVSLGYPPDYLYAVDITPNTMNNIQAAMTFIAPAAESLLARSDRAAKKAGYTGPSPQRLDIIGHSMGAVSSRWYAVKLRPDRVHLWIALAGANHGTNSLCAYNDEGAREMCPAFATDPVKNKVQVELNGTTTAPIDETPYGIGTDGQGIVRISPDNARSIVYYSIRIEPDDWIKPESSAIIDGGGGVTVSVPSGVPVIETSPGNYLFTGATDHDNLPAHPELIRFVAALLSNDISVGVRNAETEDHLPIEFSLSPNFPNPFNNGTMFHYHIPKPAYVVIRVYSIVGREIRTLMRQRQEAGF